jgi:holliday junction DNA helicase RuvA
MISYLKGDVIVEKERFIVLEVNNIGFKVFLSKKTLSKISEKQKGLKLFCFSAIGENRFDLYGFLDYKELEFFQLVEKIKGVGPKAALEISSLGPIEKIKERIEKRDSSLFKEIPGIGRKKAMAIILELSGEIESPREKPSRKDEAEEVLVNLGFPRQESRETLKKISREGKTAEQRVKQALKILGEN